MLHKILSLLILSLFFSNNAIAEPPPKLSLCPTNHKLVSAKYLHHSERWLCPTNRNPQKIFLSDCRKLSPQEGHWCVVAEPVTPIRLKHINTGKCVYGFKKSQNTWEVYNWTCWADPGMAFVIINIDANKFKLKDQTSGKCLAAQNSNGAKVVLDNCSSSSPAMIFTKEPTTGNKFRLKSMIGQCLYGNSSNGGPVKSWGCWNDPGLEFMFEYY